MECIRGQFLYKQDQDKINKLYFIKNGDFEISKEVPNRHEKESPYFDEQGQVDYSKLKKSLNFKSFNVKGIKKMDTIEKIPICILTDGNMFGLEEYFSPE